MKKGFTNRELVIMAILIAISGPFQFLWAHLCFNLKFLGPLTGLFGGFGFMIWCYLALYFVPKPGAATIVKTIGAVIEVMLGNPVGVIAIAYGAIEGIGADLAFMAFKRKMTINMMIVAALFQQIITAPIELVQNAIPFQFLPILVFLGPGIPGTVFTGWFSSVVIGGLRKAGIWKKYAAAE